MGDIEREEISCSNMDYCSTICYPTFGMSKNKATELCNFANYNNDNIIDENDYTDCLSDASLFSDSDYQFPTQTSMISTELSIRGGNNFGCVPYENQNIVTPVKLLYDLYAYYGVQIYPESENSAGSCKNDFTFPPHRICESPNGLGEYSECSVNEDCESED